MADRNKGALVGALMLVAGGIIGAGVALLFAPQSGKETRRDIARYAKKTRRKVSGAVEEFSDAVQEMAETVADRAGDLLEKGRELSHEARTELLHALEEGQAQLEKQRKRLSKLMN